LENLIYFKSEWPSNPLQEETKIGLVISLVLKEGELCKNALTSFWKQTLEGMLLYFLDGDGDGFLDVTKTYPQKWVLAPGPSKTVHLFHSCFASEKRLLGIFRCWSMAPFKQINLTRASSSIIIPPVVQGCMIASIPTLAQFVLQVGDEEDFSTLVGKNGNPITDLAKQPNSFWVHPHLFLLLPGPQPVRSANIAMLVLRFIHEENLEDNEHPMEDEIGI
jgi:hypothetical protein